MRLQQMRLQQLRLQKLKHQQPKRISPKARKKKILPSIKALRITAEIRRIISAGINSARTENRQKADRIKERI